MDCLNVSGQHPGEVLRSPQISRSPDAPFESLRSAEATEARAAFLRPTVHKVRDAGGVVLGHVVPLGADRLEELAPLLEQTSVADIPAVARLAVRVTCWSATTAAGERLFRDEDLDLVAGQPISALRPFLERTLEVSGFELEIEDDEDPDGGDGGTDPGDGGTDPGN